jgi:hypothetical protein
MRTVQDYAKPVIIYKDRIESKVKGNTNTGTWTGYNEPDRDFSGWPGNIDR